MKRRRLLKWMGSVALAAVLAGTSCSTSPDSSEQSSEPSCVRDETPFSLSAETYADVGKPGSAKGTSQPFVVVFDEQHDSRVGQVEIAIMLNRLHRTANLRHLGLEGSVLEEQAPDLSWFTSLPDENVRRAVALQLLRQGEVSAAEFAAMALSGFTLHPIEHDDEYQVDLPAGATRSYTGYLVAIATTTMTPDEATKATALLDQDKYDEAIEFIVGTDPWTSERYQLLERETPVVTTDEMQVLGDELEAKALDVGADTTEYSGDLQVSQKFFDTATQRSETMVANTADLATERLGDCAPIAMNIGAAHTTHVAALLGERNMSSAVVSPLALSAKSDNGGLSTEAYGRKLNAQSVDPNGTIGALLDGRRKPSPSSQTAWFRAKAELSYATVVIARAAAAGGGDLPPPYNLDPEKLGLGGSGPDSNITIDLSTMREVRVGDRTEVVFEVTFLEPATTRWVRAGVVAEETDLSSSETLELALKDVRDVLRNERPDASKPSSPSPKEPPVAGLSPDVKAAVAKTPEELAITKLG